jgi:1-acyl-sn-glycerol-3-phosphate acyltransferase
MISVPPPGPVVPRRGGALLSSAGRLALTIMRWRFEGAVPDRPRVVILVAPHTSNWDFVVGLAAAFALRLRIRFLGKDTLFGPPLGWFMSWAGGIPVKRDSPEGVVEAAVASFRNEALFYLAITPEGTRRRVGRFKTGFWRIARAADVPVWTVALDWSRKVVRLDAAFETSSHLDADLSALQERFGAAMARRPENYGVAAPADPSLKAG